MAGSEHVSGAHVPLGTHRADVIADLVRGISPEESRLRRRRVLRRAALMFALLAVRLAMLVLDPKGWKPSDLLWNPVLLMGAAATPFFVIEYRRLGSRPPIALEQAERLGLAGQACARCGEVPLRGIPVCPSCWNLLRPWAVLVWTTVVLLLLLLAVFYRHGAFTS